MSRAPADHWPTPALTTDALARAAASDDGGEGRGQTITSRECRAIRGPAPAEPGTPGLDRHNHIKVRALDHQIDACAADGSQRSAPLIRSVRSSEPSRGRPRSGAPAPMRRARRAPASRAPNGPRSSAGRPSSARCKRGRTGKRLDPRNAKRVDARARASREIEEPLSHQMYTVRCDCDAPLGGNLAQHERDDRNRLIDHALRTLERSASGSERMNGDAHVCDDSRVLAYVCKARRVCAKSLSARQPSSLDLSCFSARVPSIDVVTGASCGGQHEWSLQNEVPEPTARDRGGFGGGSRGRARRSRMRKRLVRRRRKRHGRQRARQCRRR